GRDEGGPVDRVLCQRVPELDLKTRERPQFGWRDAHGRECGEIALERDAEAVDDGSLLEGRARRDMCAPPAPAHEQPLRLEKPHRLAHRRPADLERLRQLGLRHLLPGGEASLDDRLLEHAAHVLWKRGRRPHLQRQEPRLARLTYLSVGLPVDLYPRLRSPP